MAAIVRTIQGLKRAIATLDLIELGYTRVSTELESQDSSIARQIEDFEDAGCNLIVVERQSGTNTTGRSLYLAIVELVKSKRVAKIRVGESSRLNRNEAETTYFERLCEVNKIPLIYLDEPELNGDSYRIKELRRDKAIAAEAYSRQLGLNVRKGNERKKKNSKPVSRVPTFGYRFAADKSYEIDWAKDDLSNVIGRDRASGKLYATGEIGEFLIDRYIELESQSQAFKKMKLLLDKLEVINRDLWQKTKNRTSPWFGHWLRNPNIRGHLAYNQYKQTYTGDRLDKKVCRKNPRHEWEYHYNTHSALLDPEREKQVERILKNNQNYGWAMQNSTRDRSTPASLSRLLKCNCCGLAMNTTSTTQQGKKYRYYYCTGKKEFRCNQGNISESKLIKLLLQNIIEKAEELTEILYRAKVGDRDPRAIEIEKLKVKGDRILDLHKDIGDETLLISYQNIISQINQIEREINSDRERSEEKELVLSSLQDIDFWDSMSAIELHDYLKAIVKVVWIEDKQVVKIELLI